MFSSSLRFVSASFYLVPPPSSMPAHQSASVLTILLRIGFRQQSHFPILPFDTQPRFALSHLPPADRKTSNVTFRKTQFGSEGYTRREVVGKETQEKKESGKR
jgi:hypothetical protein